MKINKIVLMMLGGALLATSCNDLNEQEFEGGTLSTARLQESNSADTKKANATFEGMFSYLGTPCSTFGTSQGRADDFGMVMASISLDLEGADMAMGDNGYNWFSVASELSSRNADYANPYIRYVTPYREIGIANQVIASVPENTTNKTLLYNSAQAHAIIAFDYLMLAPYYQFAYDEAADQPCVPIIADSLDAANNSRATVRQVYQIIKDNLDYAVENLAGYDRGGDKQKIDQHVAYALRARANLYMGNYADAAADAEKALEGYTPASRAEVSEPGFDDISAHNWIWGIDITPDQASIMGYATASSWISAFSGDGYAPATDNVPVINKLLYDKIPSTDVRKSWWLDENKHSDAWANLSWGDAKGDAIADLVLDGVKNAYAPYMSIKFGQKAGVGSTDNSNDFPLIRVEEMILTRAEGLLKSGHEAEARQVLENFVKNYRDPSYSANGRGLSLADEIWFQRRVELWGEGFFTADMKRLHKPLVRFHGEGTTNFPDAFVFNVAANDGWLNMRFPTSEKDNNPAIVDNQGGALPVSGQNPDLRDGVTD